MRSVVFICYGNICRSPYAAVVFSRMADESLGLPIAVTSAGFVGPDRRPPPEAMLVATRRGLDLGTHRSQLITTALLESADLVVVMSAEQAVGIGRRGPLHGSILVLGDLDPWPITTRTIRDPWGEEVGVFEQSYARIERCIAALVSALALTDLPAIKSVSN